MPSKFSAGIKALWLRAWPAWVCVGFAGFCFVVSVIGNVPALQPYRVSNFAVVAGIGLLAVFGVPLLVAWAFWSLFQVRGLAFRIGIYVVLLLADLGFLFWLIVNFFIPQM